LIGTRQGAPDTILLAIIPPGQQQTVGGVLFKHESGAVGRENTELRRVFISLSDSATSLPSTTSSLQSRASASSSASLQSRASASLQSRSSASSSTGRRSTEGLLASERPFVQEQQLFGDVKILPLSAAEVEAGQRRARQDLGDHLTSESGYGLLAQQFESDWSEVGEFSTGRRLKGVPSRRLPNAALEALATRIIRVLGGEAMKPHGPLSCDLSRCKLAGRRHEGIMYPPGTCQVQVPTVCTSWGLSTSNAHRGSDFLHQTLHVYTLRLMEANKAHWHFRRYQIFDEPFNDCLTQLMGGSFLNYGSCSQRDRVEGIKLLRMYPVLGYPWINSN
jgi:hypothetical protein